MGTWFVTGGAGFIGASLIHVPPPGRAGAPGRAGGEPGLTCAGNQGTLATFAPQLEAKGRYAFHHADVADGDEVAGIFEAPRPKVVVHFAAESHVDRLLREPSVYLRTTVLGTQVLLDAALRQGIERFQQVSADEVYGSLDDGQFTEDSRLDPRSPYVASKASADLLCGVWASTWGLPVTISRCGNNYGPYQFPEKLIPLALTKLLAGGTVPIYGDGQNVRDWIHAEDH